MSTVPAPTQLVQEGRTRSLVDFYLTTMRTEVQLQFQYRAAIYMYLLGMVAEPVIYLVVWTTIAEQSGGTVGGLTTGELAAYYIVWTLVRNMNLVFTPAEVLAVTLSAVIAGQICGDGESNWLEGVQLLAVYVILALLFYFLPAHSRA